MWVIGLGEMYKEVKSVWKGLSISVEVGFEGKRIGSLCGRVCRFWRFAKNNNIFLCGLGERWESLKIFKVCLGWEKLESLGRGKG